MLNIHKILKNSKCYYNFYITTISFKMINCVVNDNYIIKYISMEKINKTIQFTKASNISNDISIINYCKLQQIRLTVYTNRQAHLHDDGGGGSDRRKNMASIERADDRSAAVQ